MFFLEVSNYPWGFRLKTKRRTWIETNKTKGDRVCFSTLNPKTDKWCAVKKSTYNAVDVLLIDENEHIKSIGLWKYGTNEKDLENFISKYAIYHQRYSTNTFPTWSLAQPFRVIAHNGEINTLKGNKNWMNAHEPRMKHKNFANNIDDLKPVIDQSASDSAALDLQLNC